MKYLFALLFLFPMISSANSIDLIEEKTNYMELISKANIDKSTENDIEDDYFCRICVTLQVYEPNAGSQISITSCAGNVFTSCEKASEKANAKLMVEIAKMVIEMN